MYRHMIGFPNCELRATCFINHIVIVLLRPIPNNLQILRLIISEFFRYKTKLPTSTLNRSAHARINTWFLNPKQARLDLNSNSRYSIRSSHFKTFRVKKKKKKPPSDPSYSKFYTPPLVNILNGPSILHPPVLSIKLHTVRSNPSPIRCRSLPLQPKFKILLQGTMLTAANKNPSASSAPSTLSIPLYYYFRLSF